MDLHLQNVRSGDTYKLSPDRTLIGSADHANIRTAGDVYLAALAVRYPSGWALFGLSDDPEVTFNRQPLRAVQRVAPKKGDLLIVRGERYAFIAPGNEAGPEPPEPVTPPPCFATIKDAEGMEECRAVDHDLLFGRMDICHVQLADAKLSRLGALLASDDGTWYIHALSKKAIGLNRKAVPHTARVENGDELLIGPLVVRLEIRTGGRAPEPDSRSEAPVNNRRPSRPSAEPTGGPTGGSHEKSETTDDGTGSPTEADGSALTALRARAEQLERWLRGQEPPASAPRSGLGGWLENQRDRLRRFWFDTPETTSARSLRAAKRVAEAFSVLDRAIRARPDGPELLRELYRLYEAVGFTDLCFRPLRQIEKLAEARGSADTWVLEELARLCERLGPTRAGMFDRAVGYWTKLEVATGVSYSRQKSNVLALRAIHARGGSAPANDD
jgi:hypothetical protein